MRSGDLSRITKAFSGEAGAPDVLPHPSQGLALLLTFDVDLNALGHGQALVIVGFTAEERRLGQT